MLAIANHNQRICKKIKNEIGVEEGFDLGSKIKDSMFPNLVL